MAAEIIKLAGPDRDGNYKVLSTKNTYRVEPGEVYTRNAYRHLVQAAQRSPNSRKLDVTAVEAKLPDLAQFGLEGASSTFSEESGGKVLDVKDLLNRD